MSRVNKIPVQKTFPLANMTTVWCTQRNLEISQDYVKRVSWSLLEIVSHSYNVGHHHHYKAIAAAAAKRRPPSPISIRVITRDVAHTFEAKLHHFTTLSSQYFASLCSKDFASKALHLITMETKLLLVYTVVRSTLMCFSHSRSRLIIHIYD